MSPQKTVKSDRSDVVISSSDPRTQKIFNELFKIPANKSKKITKARPVKPQPRPAKVRKNHPDQTTNLDKLSSKESSEKAFESFLDQMFIATPDNDSDKTKGFIKEIKNDKSSDKSAKVVKMGPPKAEKEL